MARRRMIDPRIWESEQFSELSLFERLLYIGLISHADDEGRLRDHVSWIRATIFPYDDVPLRKVEAALERLENVGLVLRYRAKEWDIIAHPKWHVYQKPDHAKPSKFPACAGEKHGLRNNSPNDSGNDSLLGKVRLVKETCAQNFNQFWAAYPKKKSKGDAQKAFNAIKPDEQLLATMIATIERATTSEDWRKEGGKYIPYPATWLRARGWEDEELDLPTSKTPLELEREAYANA